MTIFCSIITVSKDTPPHKTDNDNDDDRKNRRKGLRFFRLYNMFCFESYRHPAHSTDLPSSVSRSPYMDGRLSLNTQTSRR